MTVMVLASLAAGSALAQDTPIKGAGPDQDQANNERYWGIVNNTNNAYKTWPSSLRDPAFDRYAVRQGRVTGSTPPPTSRPLKPAATATPDEAAAAATPPTPATPATSATTAAAGATATPAQQR
jgi:hypothetical protein